MILHNRCLGCLTAAVLCLGLGSASGQEPTLSGAVPRPAAPPRYLADTTCYAADPAAHLFAGRLWVYCSHDWRSPVTDHTDGNHYDMRETLLFSTADPDGGTFTPHGAVLSLDQIAWASRQLWAPDAAEAGGRYYLYFPARDREGIFRIGVAEAARPEGPYAADPEPIAGAYSIDPAVFRDRDGRHYLYFGGLQGGQLQRWRDNELLANEAYPAPDAPALAPRVALLSDDMHSLAEASQPIEILGPDGRPLTASDPHRFFEAVWMHERNGVYYLSYSTGTTHLICYATGDNPRGPFRWRGVVLTPVSGWTTHHAIVEAGGRWWLFYHDCLPSGGVSSLRSAKYCELEYLPDGSIRTVAGDR